MPWLVVAMSMFASITSATSYMGIPGDAYSETARSFSWVLPACWSRLS